MTSRCGRARGAAAASASEGRLASLEGPPPAHRGGSVPILPLQFSPFQWSLVLIVPPEWGLGGAEEKPAVHVTSSRDGEVVTSGASAGTVAWGRRA